MNFDYTAGRFWFGIGQYLIAAAIGFYAWFSNKQKAQTEEVAKVEQSVTALEIRIIKLESNVITHEELGKVYDRINDLSDEVSEIKGALKPMNKTLNRIEEYLMNKGG